MKVLINVPDEIYKKIQDLNVDESFIIEPYKWIKNGTPFPKGHGRILDEKDILDAKNNDSGWYDLVDMPEYIAGVKAIIEADEVTE